MHAQKSTLPYTIPAPAALNLATELTISQRYAATMPPLSEFLQKNIFPRLRPFSSELYLSIAKGVDQTLRPIADGQEHQHAPVPVLLPFPNPEITRVLKLEQPSLFTEGSAIAEFVDPTGNQTHLLIPFGDGEQVNSQTISAVIGSRLRSMHTIIQLQKLAN